VFMKAHGKIIWWMEMASYITAMENLLIKVNGGWISFMEWEKFITKINSI
jgi:hypothetical protein